MAGSCCLVLLMGLMMVGYTEGACDTGAITSCVGDMAAIGSPQSSPISMQEFRNMCEQLKSALSCLKNALSACDAGAAAAFQTTVDMINGSLGQSCNHMMECSVGLSHCAAQIPQIDVSNIPSADALTTHYCGYISTMSKCFRNQDMVKRSCNAIDAIETMMAPFLELESACYEKSCVAVQSCKAAFQAGNPAPSGVDFHTCTLFSAYSGCVVNARCDGESVELPEGTPRSRLPSFVSDACSLFAEDSPVWACADFTTCVSTFMDSNDILRPDKMCPGVQKIAGCAAKHAGTCGVPNSATVVIDLNHYMIKLGSNGCGEPGVDATSCPKFSTCKSALTAVLGGSSPSFNDICVAAKDFLQCAGTAASTCGLLPPDSEVSGLPTLQGLVPIATQLCTELSGQTVEGCTDFLDCLGSDRNIPSTDGGLLNPAQWCQSATKTIECAKALETRCGVSADLMSKLEATKTRFTDSEGKCQDYYSDLSAAGTQVVVDVLLVYMLPLSLALPVTVLM